MLGNVVKKCDIVLKEKQKDKTRKGGKLVSRYGESTYTVVDIHQNANIKKHGYKGNIENTSPPLPCEEISQKKNARQNVGYARC